MTEHTGDKESGRVPSQEASAPEVMRLQEGIEQTRTEMSETIAALETRLSPSEVRDKIGGELQHVEERVRVVVREQLDEAKALVRTELHEAKDLLRGEMTEAETRLRRGLADARDTVKQDVKDALRGAKEAARAATLGKVEDLATNLGDKMNQTRDTLVDTIRSNPLPAAMVGVGLAWLLMNRSSSASQRGAAGEGRTGARLSDAVTRGVHDATDAAGGALHKVADSAGSLAHRAGDAASHLASEAGDVATSAAGTARRGAERVSTGFQHTLQESPVAVGAAVLALGAVVGLSLPRTQREDALMGASRDELLDRASGAAHDAAGAVASLAEKTGERAKKSMQQSVNE